jgi:nicotinate-nucleotide adenylyltransferase
MAENVNTLPNARIGLFGGTFDPVHLGHLSVAMDVKDGFGLDRIIVIPSAVPPHKTGKRISRAEDRLAMARLCFGNRKGFEVSDVELKREGPSYTIDTVTHFMGNLGPGEQVMLIMGTDAFFEIHTWRNFLAILSAVHLIVMKRPGIPGDLAERAADYLKTTVDEGYRLSESGFCFTHPINMPVHFFEVGQRDESSTEIRQRIKNDLDVSAFLLPEVAEYIREKGLYR